MINSFVGHIAGGSISIVYGVLWLFLWFLYYLKYSQRNQGGQSTCNSHSNDLSAEQIETLRVFGHHTSPRSPHVPCPVSGGVFCCLSKFPFEAIFKICFILGGGMIVEIFFDQADTDGTHHSTSAASQLLNNVSKLHHITFYGVFVLSGVIDLIVVSIHAIPRNVSKFALSLAFMIELLLVLNHETSGDTLIVFVHRTAQAIVLGLTALFTLLRIPKPGDFIVNTLVGVMLVLRGTWLIQISLIIFSTNSMWQDDRNRRVEQLKLAVVLFSWHVIGCMLFAGLLYLLLLTVMKYSRCRKNVWRPNNVNIGEIHGTI